MKKLLFIPMLFLMFLSGINAQVDSVLQLTIKGSVGIQDGDTGTPPTLIPEYEVMFSDVFFLVPFLTDSTGNFEFVYEFPLGTEKEVTVSVIDLCNGEKIEKKFKSTAGEVRADFILCQDIIVPPNPSICMAYFGYENGSEPFSIQFNDLSYGNEVNSWKWDFGDGTSSTEQNPYHVYDQNGQYAVQLSISTVDDCNHKIEKLIKVTDDCNCPDIYDPVCIVTPSGGFLTFNNKCEAVCQGYSPDMFVECQNDTTDCFVNIHFIQDPQNQFNYKFIAELDLYGPNSPNSNINYTWDFGDGVVVEGSSEIEHLYSEEGDYTVILIVNSDYSKCFNEIKIHVGNCICPEIYDPVCVKSDEGIISFDNKCFALCAGYSEDDFVQCETDNCGALITLSESELDDLLSVKFNVDFIPLPVPQITYSWDFGDGTFENTQNSYIVHTYPNEGIYTAILTIDYGQNTCTTKVEVKIPYNDGGCVCPDIWDPVCVKTPNGIVTFGNFCEAECEGFTQNDIVPCQADSCFASLIISKTDTWNTFKFSGYSFSLVGSPDDKYFWNFGDGTNGEGAKTYHEYQTEGQYEVSLSIVTADGLTCTTTTLLVVSEEDPCICPDIWDPICVKTPNGIFTYANLCEAECAGYTIEDAVPCQDEPCYTSIIVSSTDDPMTLDFSTDFVIPVLDSLPQDSLNLLTFTWDFGDGTTATGSSVQHTFVDEGGYTVLVKINGVNIECKGSIEVKVPWDAGCACDAVYDPVCVETPNGIISYSNACFAICDGYNVFVSCDTIEHCQANIWYNISNDNPLMVSFSAETLDPITSNNIEWDFGDGTSSNELSPTHTYAENGIYEVTVSIKNETCTTTGWTIVCVHDGDWFPNDCQAIFDAYPINENNTMYQFKDLSPSDVTSWNWDFGDGSTSTEQHPTHLYENDGLYEVILHITTADDCASKTFNTIFVGGDDPVDTSYTCQAIFGYFQTATTTYTVNFEDYSFGEVTSWSWDFGDGTTSTDADPVHIYSQTGEYLVTLKIITEDCESKVTQPILVVDDIVTPLDCQAFFFFDADQENPNLIHFKDFSYDEVTGWKWSFGDGETSTEQDPEHLYAETGIYTVKLQIKTASDCIEVFEMEIYVGDEISIPDDCSALFTGVINDLEVSFQDLSKSTTPITEWHWDFGDHQTSELQNPVHKYSELGVYDVLLRTVSEGCESKFIMKLDLYNGIFSGRPFAAYTTTDNENIENVVENVIIYPNPVHEATNLSFMSSNNQELTVTMVTATGQTVSVKTYDVRVGKNNIQLNTSDMQEGVYFLQIQSEKGTMALKFIK